MKTEDFERLKAVCEKEGFEIEACSYYDVITVKKKDPWQGVEFAECLINATSQYSIGRIYKVKEVTKSNLLTELDDRLRTTNGHSKYNFKPSTESAYIEQLKKEAHERFGGIKEGDRFEIEGSIELTVDYGGMGFRYYKDQDLLCHNGYHLYQQGKWATRVKEGVKVEPTNIIQSQRDGFRQIDFVFRIPNKDIKLNGAQLFLASQLEAYLNLDGYSVDVSGETLSIHVKIRNGVDLEDLKEKAESLAKIVKKI